MIHLTPYFHRKSIQFRDTIDLIPEKFHTIGIIRGIRRNDLQHITTHPKSTTGKIHVVAHILHIYQLSDHLIPILLIPRPQGNHHILVVIRATNTIDAGYRRYDNDIAPLCQGCRSRQTQLVDLIIDGGILGNIGIGRRNICLRLIVIIIGYKIFHRIIGKKFFKLSI